MSITQEVVTKIPDLKKKKVSITPPLGGLTSSNFKVEVDGVPYFVRIPGAGTELLAIHRENEQTLQYKNTFDSWWSRTGYAHSTTEFLMNR